MGEILYIVYCDKCHCEISRRTVTTPVTGNSTYTSSSTCNGCANAANDKNTDGKKKK